MNLQQAARLLWVLQVPVAGRIPAMTNEGAGAGIIRQAKEKGILRICMAVLPFEFDTSLSRTPGGRHHFVHQADAMLVISHDRIRQHDGSLSIEAAFAKTEGVIAPILQAVSDVLAVKSEVNVDIDDIKMVVRNSGTLVVGTATAAGSDRVLKVVDEALSFPFFKRL